MKELSEKKRIEWIKRTVLCFFLIGILLSFKLWISDRNFPMTPLFDSLNSISSSVNYVLFFCSIGLIISLFFIKNRWLYFSLLILFVFLILQDQNRLQPWVYIYLLLLLSYFLFKEAKHQQLNFMRIILIGVYFWSGMQKLNPQFNEVAFKSILSNLFGITDPDLLENLLPFGYLLPVIETSAALLLCFPKTRKWGVYILILMHLFILVYISPLGINSNTTVYPWNVAMMLFLLLVFYSDHSPIFTAVSFEDLKIRIITALVWILPVLNFFGYWDHYLSFSLFSGKTDKYYIMIHTSEVSKINPEYCQYFTEIKNLPDKKLIDISAWSVKELNVPFYPEMRTFRSVAKSFCSFGIEDGKVYFLEMDQENSDGNYVEFTCSDLSN